MTVGLRADAGGTFGELLLGGSPVVRFDSGGLTTTTSGQDYYNQANILGVVSQSGGVPTGAIIERGSNANGNYTRFADGTQVCQITRVDGSFAISGALVGGFASTAIPWTFPAAFSAIPGVSSNPAGGTAFGTMHGSVNVATTDYHYTAVTSQGAASRTVTLLAIGRWF